MRESSYHWESAVVAAAWMLLISCSTVTAQNSTNNTTICRTTNNNTFTVKINLFAGPLGTFWLYSIVSNKSVPTNARNEIEYLIGINIYAQNMAKRASIFVECVRWKGNE